MCSINKRAVTYRAVGSALLWACVLGSPAEGVSNEALRREVQRQIEDLTAPLREQIKQLEAQNATLQDQIKLLKRQQKDFNILMEGVAKPTAPSPPTANIPSYSNPAGPNIINDINCRPRLSHNSKAPGMNRDPAREYCKILHPGIRLVLENMIAGVTGGYTNIAGSPNLGANLAITETATHFYQVGIGYVQKPVLRQIRALFDDPDKPRAITSQNSLLDDFLFNAVQLSAGIGYGRALTIKNDDRINTENDRPQYSATLSYSLDLQRTYIHLFHGGLRGHSEIRPVDAGYYYAPPSGGFWNADGDNGSIAYGLATPSPAPTDTPTME